MTSLPVVLGLYGFDEILLMLVARFEFYFDPMYRVSSVVLPRYPGIGTTGADRGLNRALGELELGSSCHAVSHGQEPRTPGDRVARKLDRSSGSHFFVTTISSRIIFRSSSFVTFFTFSKFFFNPLKVRLIIRCYRK